jgi:tetratricopeptide (TPR) repeat protein
MRSIFLLSLALLAACGARSAQPTTANKVVEMEGVRIVAKHDAQGGYSFESYDAEELFKRANAELDAGRCKEAVELYDRLVREFPGGRFVSASLYNAGLCLAQSAELEAALGHFTRLVTELPTSPDVKHASFQIGHLLVTLARWDEALGRADALLARQDLDAPERMEAMAMRAQVLLGRAEAQLAASAAPQGSRLEAGKLEPALSEPARTSLQAAQQDAQQALTFYRTRGSELAADPYYAAAANYVVAECIRLRAEALSFPDTNQEEQKAILVRRAELLLDAMREYANTITHTSSIVNTNPKWAAASGYRIGAMYDKLWHDLMSAPVPQTLSEGAKEQYPKELAKLIKPLLRHAIRYWELTLLMAERTGGQGEWVQKTRDDLERTRGLLLEQPPGPGGLPPPAAKPAAPPGAPSSGVAEPAGPGPG